MIDLSKCKKGQKLRLRNGWQLMFAGVLRSSDEYPYHAANCDVHLCYQQDGTLQKGIVSPLDIIEIMKDSTDAAVMSDVVKLSLISRDICHQCSGVLLKKAIAVLEPILSERLSELGLTRAGQT